MNPSEKWHIIQQKALHSCLTAIFEEFAIAALDAICIKGWSLARFYPESRQRTYNDIDLVVNPSDYQNALELLRKLPFKGISVDVHSGIRDRDTLSWEDLFSRSYIAKLDGTDVRVLGHEDNLRITAAHWLIDGGVFKEKLWDIYYLASNTSKNLDWDRCLNVAGPVRRTWVLTAIATARDYIGLDVSEFPREVKDFELPGWYRRTLEREWSREPATRIPLISCLKRPGLLMEQLRRRIPPNPIAATTDTEGPINELPRWPYQFNSIKKKLINASPFARNDYRVESRVLSDS